MCSRNGKKVSVAGTEEVGGGIENFRERQKSVVKDKVH